MLFFIDIEFLKFTQKCIQIQHLKKNEFSKSFFENADFVFSNFQN